MYNQEAASRLAEKSSLHGIEVELREGYNLSPVEARVLAQRVQEMVDERAGGERQPDQITYQAIAADESGGKPLAMCRCSSPSLPKEIASCGRRKDPSGSARCGFTGSSTRP